MSKINFFSEVNDFKFGNKEVIISVLNQISKDNSLEIKELTVIFKTDEGLLEVNKTFLNHDFFTDVITFDLSEDNRIEGEIYISIDRVKENATDYKVAFEYELSRVIIHGLLHLVGYSDKGDSEQKEMRNQEEKYLGYVSRETIAKNG